MSTTARWRRLAIPALAALPVLALLVSLGAWQTRRLAWKTDLLSRIEAAEAGPALTLGADPPPAFTKVVAAGRLDHTREALLGVEVRGTTLGAHLLTPLLREGLPPVLVDRGWVPLARDAAVVQRPDGLLGVTGYVREPVPRGSLAAVDDAAGRRFYTFDPQAIGLALGLPAVAPFGLVALASPGGGDAPLPAAAPRLPRPNNPHLGYAITWFGLAAALVGVFAVFAWRRLKEQP